MIKQVYYLGIDISKGYADIVLLDSQGKIEMIFDIEDTFNGHVKLFSILSEFLADRQNAEMLCGVESTGGYENNIYAKLRKFSRDLPLKVARINPLGIHYTSKAELTGVTTDQTSAYFIAQ